MAKSDPKFPILPISTLKMTSPENKFIYFQPKKGGKNGV